jgi:hypothetical protein
MAKAPACNTYRLSYGAALSKLNGSSVFGGYGTGKKPEGWGQFISNLEQVRYSQNVN